MRRSTSERGEATLAARTPIKEHYGPMQTRDVIGTRNPRLDARAKVTGDAKFSGDIRLEGMLYAVVLRSPHASAKVLSIDTGVAAGMPGVGAILTYNGKRIRHAGAEVAAVAADTLDHARDAMNALQVTYEVYDSVVTTEDAMEPGAPAVYETKPNVGNASVRERGDLAAGFADADVIVEGDYRTQVQTHSPMESNCAVVRWTSGTSLEAWVSTQGVFSTADEFADYFGLPPENVRVYCDYIGGGFGSKLGAGTAGVMAAELAQLTGKPVKLVFDRKGQQTAAGNRSDSIQHLKIGARSDGTITAIDVVGYGTPGIGSGAGFAEACRSLYEVESYRTSETSVYTNCGTAMTMRAPGHPQGAYSMECILDDLAYELGMDPLELRLANNRYPVRKKQFQLAAERFGWSARNPLPGADSGPIKRGMGLASCTWSNGGQPGCTVRVTVGTDGSILIENGANDIGTGTRTWMAMLVAEELGIKPEQIEVRLGDSNLPNGPMAAGSTTTPTLSPPTREAGANARLAIAEEVAPLMGTTPESLEFKNGQIIAPSGATISFAEGCSYLGSPVVVEGSRTDDAKLGSDAVMGVQFAEVEVDVRTGKIAAKRVLAVHCAGRILNLLTAESQVYGGVIQGMNYALFEERIMDRNLGIMLNANLEGYKIGGAKDMPEIEVSVDDLSSGGTYVGALGLGEAPVIPTAGAIANAVYHAIGVRVRALPMTPARVLEALGTISAARPARRQRMGGRR